VFFYVNFSKFKCQNVSSGSVQRIENFKSQYIDHRNIDVLPEAGLKHVPRLQHDGIYMMPILMETNKPGSR
jgi:hypothetical protein